MVECTRETGLTTNVRVKDFTSHMMEPNIVAHGKMTSKMDRVPRPGPLELSTRECIRTGSNMEMESSDGLTTVNSMAISTLTTSKAKENTTGLMEELTKAPGTIIKCTEKACCVGKTERCIREITIWIRKKDMGCSHGQKERSTKGTGKIINSMAKDTTSLKVENGG